MEKKKTKYNTTQLSPESTFERHVYHRDQFAHYLRWTHVLKRAKIGMNILDVGCGTGGLAEVLYRNRYKAEKYIGLDIRKKTIADANKKYKKVDWIKFIEKDLCEKYKIKGRWDMITSFEVLEHIGKKNGKKFLENIVSHMSKNTVFLLSTPSHDPKVGAAANHIIDGEVGEYDYSELEELLKKYFVIKEVYGTFASQRDYKDIMNPWQKKMFEAMHKYYDSNLISNIMAPLFPELARNCIWVLKKK